MSDEFKVMALIVVVCIAGFAGFVWLSAVNESATYNRLTGAKTTPWDALWVELRVQDAPKKD